MAKTSLHISRHHSPHSAAHHATHGTGKRGVGGEKTYATPQSKRRGKLFFSRTSFCNVF